jgi:FemAB-related protein (PEP-CTERM system-associated)
LIANVESSDVSLDAVQVALESGGAAWDAFLAEHTSVGGGATFYHLFDWQQINSLVLKHQSIYLSARRGGQIVGVLPLVFIDSKLFGRILCSVPFVNYGGPVAVDDVASRALIAAAVNKANELKADYLELRAARELPTDLPVSLRKVSMTLALDADPENLWKNFSSKHRNNVRRIQKQGLRVQSGGGELLKEFYAVMEASWGALGTPMYSRAYFQRIVDVFGDRVRIFVCYKDDTPIAVAFNGHFGETVEGMWAGGRPEFRDAQANYVLYWEMMRDACVRGFKRYHLGRSSADSGGEQFKKKWNAETTQLHWYFHHPDGGAMPELNVDNPKYKLAINVWQRLPVAVTRVIGPPLARSIP